MNMEDYRVKAKENIDKLFDLVERVNINSNKLKDELKLQYDEKKETINQLKQDLDKRYKELQQSSKVNYEKAKKAYELKYEELKSAIAQFHI